MRSLFLNTFDDHKRITSRATGNFNTKGVSSPVMAFVSSESDTRAWKNHGTILQNIAKEMWDMELVDAFKPSSATLRGARSSPTGGDMEL
ncbi:hypothetical protein BS47DRAFT_1339500 [Hydnum rufescens UP504]|uniref:Uncharacterized protein n=1 Tax=Hydnum rufescens UP504 TaxID=1448309 RepID=A0A9P6B4T5_9AGAM|nr:hypothetical protein BS47DRAFT_1339500 [Hydnum rufescens UP504]